MKIRIPATNVAELVRRRASQVEDKVALIDGDSRVTWGALDQLVDAHARGLAATGLVAGHRVALSLPNSVQFVVSYLAILRAGMVAVPLNPTSNPGEVARTLADSGARVCVCEGGTVQTVRAGVASSEHFGQASARDELAPLAPRLVVAGAPPDPGEVAYDDLAVPGAAVMSPRDNEALAVLMYTSGTSDRPRGAMLSHRALLANIGQASQTRPPPVKRDDIVLGVLPLFHVCGLNAVLGQVLLQGATLVLARRFHAEETLRAVAAQEVTCVPVAPPVISAWVDRDDTAGQLASVRTLVCGAGPLSEALVRRFEERIGVEVEQGYGLTETAPVVTSTVGTPVHKPGSSGRAVPGVELRVVDDAGDDAGVEDPGVILVRGANLFSGYWPGGSQAPSPGSWLRTGDIGFIDADGDLFVVDRAKEVVIVSGFRVYPSEVEGVVNEVGDVRECAVIGVPDESTGESVHAYVVAAELSSAAALPAVVRSHCEQRLARFKVPVTIEVVDELPHSATGQVAKGRLRARQRRSMGLV